MELEKVGESLLPVDGFVLGVALCGFLCPSDGRCAEEEVGGGGGGGGGAEGGRVATAVVVGSLEGIVSSSAALRRSSLCHSGVGCFSWKIEQKIQNTKLSSAN